jgi:hypothetical protein
MIDDGISVGGDAERERGKENPAALKPRYGAMLVRGSPAVWSSLFNAGRTCARMFFSSAQLAKLPGVARRRWRL